MEEIHRFTTRFWQMVNVSKTTCMLHVLTLAILLTAWQGCRATFHLQEMMVIFGKKNSFLCCKPFNFAAGSPLDGCWPKLDQTCIIYHVIISLSSRSRNQSVSGGSTPAKRYGCLGKFARNTWTWKGHLIRQCFIFWLNTSIKCTCVVSLIRF